MSKDGKAVKHIRLVVDAEVHRQVKQLAAREETTLTDLLTTAVCEVAIAGNGKESSLNWKRFITKVLSPEPEPESEPEPETEPTSQRKKASPRKQKKSLQT